MTLEILQNLIKSRQVAGGAAQLGNSSDEVAGVDQLAFRLRVPDKINVRHDNGLGGGKTMSKIIKQKSCSAMLMRLKNAPEPFGLITLLGSLETRLNFSRMMRVIVKDGDLIHTALECQPAMRTLESPQRLENVLRFNTAMTGNGDGSQGIINVMNTGKLQMAIPQKLMVMINVKLITAAA